MSLSDLEPFPLACEAFANARKVLWLVADEAPADGLLADLRAVIGGLPAIAHFIATTATDGSLEACAAGLIEYRGSRRYGQCCQSCSEDVWPMPSAAERCPHCGGPVRANVLSGALDDWVSARCERQEIEFSAWQKTPGSLLAIELGGLAGAPPLLDLARRAAALRVCCAAGDDGVGADGAIALALPGTVFVARLRAWLSSSGLLAAGES